MSTKYTIGWIMILETQQNWFHNFWTTTQIYIHFINLFPKLILVIALENTRASDHQTTQRWMRPSEAHDGRASLACRRTARARPSDTRAGPGRAHGWWPSQAALDQPRRVKYDPGGGVTRARPRRDMA